MKLERNVRMSGLVALVDGQGRTGKSILSPIVSSLDGVEIERIEPILEIIPQLVHFGKLERDAGVALLKQEIDMKLYDSTLSRMTNFRFGDDSGVLKSAFPLRYFKRLWASEGEPAVERLRRDKPVFQVKTHDTLAHSDVYFDAFGADLRLIESIRHPVDGAMSFFKRGWGERYGPDPRNYTLTHAHGGTTVPWYALGWEDIYAKSSPIDRCIRFVDFLTRRAYDGWSKLPSERREQVLVVAFEKLVVDPWREVKRLEAFIGRGATSATSRMLSRERVPRPPLDPAARARKNEEIRKLASPEAYALLTALAADYDGEGRLTLSSLA